MRDRGEMSDGASVSRNWRLETGNEKRRLGLVIGAARRGPPRRTPPTDHRSHDPCDPEGVVSSPATTAPFLFRVFPRRSVAPWLRRSSFVPTCLFPSSLSSPPPK